MKEVYKDVEIEYREKENDWAFTLRGRDRVAESLTKAREIIDRPPSSKDKTFERVKCYAKGYSQRYDEVDVTSLCAPSRWRGDDGPPTEGWSVGGERGRCKRDLGDLYPMGPENDAIMAQIREIEAEQKKLSIKKDTLIRSMRSLKETLYGKTTIKLHAKPS